MVTDSINSSVDRATARLRRGVGLLAFLIAMLSMAGTAFASSGFVAPSYPVTIVGVPTSTAELLTNGEIFFCKEANLNGALTVPGSTLSTSRGNSSCIDGLKNSWEFAPKGCHFELKPGTGNKEGLFGGEVAIGPPGCGPMRLSGEIYACERTIGAQNGLEATFENTGSGASARVLVHIRATHLKYKCVDGTERSGGSYSADWELTGSTSKGASDPLSITESFQVAPTVTTGLARNVTAGTADLYARVSPNYLATNYQFEYGPTTSYGSKVPVEAGTLEAGVPISEVAKTAGGLSANTVYHYRVVATNSQGTSYGRDRTFKTLAAGATSASLHWAPVTTQLTMSALPSVQRWETSEGQIECTEASGVASDTWDNEAAGVAVEELSFHNKGKANCTGVFGEEAQLKTNGCSLELHVGEHVNAGEAKGSLTIGKCSTEGAISMTSEFCGIAFPQYQTLSPVTYKTVGSNVEVVIAATGVSYVRTGVLCGTASESNGKYSGRLLLKGNNGSIYIE